MHLGDLQHDVKLQQGYSAVCTPAHSGRAENRPRRDRSTGYPTANEMSEIQPGYAPAEDRPEKSQIKPGLRLIAVERGNGSFEPQLK